MADYALEDTVSDSSGETDSQRERNARALFKGLSPEQINAMRRYSKLRVARPSPATKKAATSLDEVSETSASETPATTATDEGTSSEPETTLEGKDADEATTTSDDVDTVTTETEAVSATETERDSEKEEPAVEKDEEVSKTVQKAKEASRLIEEPLEELWKEVEKKAEEKP